MTNKLFLRLCTVACWCWLTNGQDVIVNYSTGPTDKVFYSMKLQTAPSKSVEDTNNSIGIQQQSEELYHILTVYLKQKLLRMMETNKAWASRLNERSWLVHSRSRLPDEDRLSRKPRRAITSNKQDPTSWRKQISLKHFPSYLIGSTPYHHVVHFKKKSESLANFKTYFQTSHGKRMGIIRDSRNNQKSKQDVFTFSKRCISNTMDLCWPDK